METRKGLKLKKRINIYEKLLSNPLRGASNNALLGLIKPPAMRVVMTSEFDLTSAFQTYYEKESPEISGLCLEVDTFMS